MKSRNIAPFYYLRRVAVINFSVGLQSMKLNKVKNYLSLLFFDNKKEGSLAVMSLKVI